MKNRPREKRCQTLARGQLHKLFTVVTAGICALLITLLPMAAPAYSAESISETEQTQETLRERSVVATVIENTDDEQVPLANINLDHQENVPGCGVHFIILAMAGVVMIWMITDTHRQNVLMKNLRTELKNELDSRKNRIA